MTSVVVASLPRIVTSNVPTSAHPSLSRPDSTGSSEAEGPRSDMPRDVGSFRPKHAHRQASLQKIRRDRGLGEISAGC